MYGELLAEHQRILRAAFAAHDGREIDTQGDSFFVAFRTAKDALAAAVDAQRDLAAEPWPEGVQVRVRMGLHTGEPRVGGERYVGIGVHRAARIGAAGHGGQVLLSSTTKELAEEDLPPGVAIRDLGERRLKDLEQRQRLYQLDIEGLPSQFKPLRTLDVELKRKRRRMYVGSALIGAAAAAVAIPVFALGQGSSGGNSAQVAPNSVAAIDPETGKVTGSVAVGARPAEIVSGFDALWVANRDDATVSRIEPKSRRVVRTIAIGVEPSGLAAGAGGIWFASPGRKLIVHGNTYERIRLGHIDPVFNSLAPTIELKHPASASGPLAAGFGAVWVTSGDGVLRIERATRRETKAQAATGYQSSLTGVTVGAGATWVSDGGNNRVLRIEQSGVLTGKIPVGNEPSALAVGEGAVWVADTADDEILRIDPGTNAVRTTIKVGHKPTGVGVGAGAVWVANSGDGTVSEIDPRRDAVTRTIRVGGSPAAIVVANGVVWVSVQEEDAGAGGTLAAGRQGGTVRIDFSGFDHTDPALSYGGTGWQVALATCARLVGYPDRPPPAGSRLVAEVARSMPTLSADKRTYTFKVRRGYRFSPPSNQTVTARTFKYTLERSLDPRTNGPAPTLWKDIEGVKAFEAGEARHVAGIRVRGDTLSIRLTRVSGSFLSRLAMPFSCAVPIGTPVDSKGLPAIPAAGPYYVASYRPDRRIILKRNPNYRGPRPHRLDGMDIALNVPVTQAIKDVEAGRADYVPVDEAPRSEVTRLASRYGPASTLGRAGKQQYFSNPFLAFIYVALNTSRPLFAHARMRQAVNFAVDRKALTRATTSFLATPTDQYLPPGMAGFRDADVYPLDGPDLIHARQLAGPGRRTAVLYTGDAPDALERARILVDNLAPIGIQVQVHAFPSDLLYKKENTKGEPFDMATSGWVTDGYYDPYDFLNILLDGNLASTIGGDISKFNDPVYNRRLEEADKLNGAARYAAYARLDADLAGKAAPLAAFGHGNTEDFFSARMGCQQIYGSDRIDLAALCIRGHAGR